MATLEQLRREAVTQRVTARRLRQPRLADGCLERALQHGLVEMMTTANPGLAIELVPRCREHPLPAPLPPRPRYFTPSASGSHTLPAPAATSASCCALTALRCPIDQRCHQRPRQHGPPIAPPSRHEPGSRAARSQGPSLAGCSIRAAAARSRTSVLPSARRHRSFAPSPATPRRESARPGDERDVSPSRHASARRAAGSRQLRKGTAARSRPGSGSMRSRPTRRQMGEKGIDLGRAKRLRVTLPVEENETANPRGVRSFRVRAVMLGSNLGAHPVEKTGPHS